MLENSPRTDGWLLCLLSGRATTYRGMLDALARFEHDMHLHIHKENNVLFPRALEMESEKGA